MDYFHTDNARDIAWLENVLRTAREGGRSVRLAVEGTSLKVKVGQGMWTAPMEGTWDDYRDGDPNPTATPRLVVGSDGKPMVTD